MLTSLTWLFILPLPIACITWTVTHEEVFKELREFCIKRSKECQNLVQRKFFYLFTCEYCFSHYVAIFFLLLTGYKLLLPDWRGYIISGFALVWIANIYMSLFALLRQNIKLDKIKSELEEERLQAKTEADTKIKAEETLNPIMQSWKHPGRVNR